MEVGTAYITFVPKYFLPQLASTIKMKKSQKVVKSCQRVDKKLLKICQKMSKSCQKMSKRCQKVVKIFVSLVKNQIKVNRPENKNWNGNGKKKKIIGIP
jgi:hypothetical protein